MLSGSRGLYAILDLDLLTRCGLLPLAFAEAILAAKPSCLQLRAKHAAPRSVLSLLRELLPLCRRAGTALFVNDRPDLALLAGADGVHVGQNDLGLSDVRSLSATLLVGVSTHSLTELEHELSGKPDYVAFGPVYATRSKVNPEPVVGVREFAQASSLAHARGVPIVAIGGIDESNVAEVREHADMVALISALLPKAQFGHALSRDAEAALEPTAALLSIRERAQNWVKLLAVASSTLPP